MYFSQVFKPRPLVDLAAAVSSGLLINEAQWIGVIARPINYSLKGAVLHIDTGPGLQTEESYVIEMESYDNKSESSAEMENHGHADQDSSLTLNKYIEQLGLLSGKIDFPDWASDVTSILWIPVRATEDRLARGSSSGQNATMEIFYGFKFLCEENMTNFVLHSGPPETKYCRWDEDNSSET